MKVSNADIRNRVIRTTGELLYKHGLKGWNMDILAQETGLAKNTLYKIIGSKERLLEEVVLSKMRRDHVEIDKILHEEKDYATAVNRITERFADLVKDSFDKVIPDILIEYPGIEKNVRSSYKEIYASLIAFILKGMDQGVMRDDVTPDFIIDLVEGIILNYLRSGYTGDAFERAFQCAMDCLVNGLRKNNGNKAG